MTEKPQPLVNERILERCPSCGNMTLFVGTGGWLVCSWLKCKDPSAAHDRLDPEFSAHITAAEARTTALKAETHAKDIAYTHDIRVERLNVAKAEAESAALRLAHADLLARAKALTWKLVVEFAFDESQAELRLLNEAIAKASHVAGSYGAQPEVRPTPVWDEGT